jgi:hypothetical protein
MNASSKSSDLSDASTSRAISTNRLWRSASVNLGGVRLDFRIQLFLKQLVDGRLGRSCRFHLALALPTRASPRKFRLLGKWHHLAVHLPSPRSVMVVCNAELNSTMLNRYTPSWPGFIKAAQFSPPPHTRKQHISRGQICSDRGAYERS